MRGRYTKLLWLSFFVVLPSCKKVVMPDVTGWSVAGILAAGMNGAATGHDETKEMNFAQTVKFLEDGAICFSAEDRKKEQIARDQACVLLKDRCTYEMKEEFKRADARLAKLRKK